MQQVDLPLLDSRPVEVGSRFILLTIMTNMALMLVAALVGTVYRFMAENYQIKIKMKYYRKNQPKLDLPI